MSCIAVNVNLPQKYLYQHSDWTKMHWHKRIIIYSVMTLAQIKISNHSGHLWYDISQGRYGIMHLVTVPILPVFIKHFFKIWRLYKCGWSSIPVSNHEMFILFSTFPSTGKMHLKQTSHLKMFWVAVKWAKVGKM